MKRRIFSLLPCLVISGLLAVQAPAQKAPAVEAPVPSAIAWQPSLERALELVKEAKKPLLICLHWQDEKASRRMLKTVYGNEAVQRRMKDFVVIGAAPDDHGDVEVRDGEKTKKVSSLYGRLPCEVFRTNLRKIQERWFDTPKVVVPQHIFVGLDGKIFLRKRYELDPGGLINLMQEAMQTFTGEALKTLDGRLRKALRTVKRGDEKERKEAIHFLLKSGDEKSIELLFHVIDGIRKEKDRAACIRAMGYAELEAAGPLLSRWLDDSSVFIVNCAVVSLEETAYPDANERMLRVYAKAKNRELKKDVLRALGPCGAESPEAKSVLLAATRSRQKIMRKAAYLSLGYQLNFENKEARAALVKGHRREGKSFLMKVPILMSYHRAADEELLPEFRDMMKRERNGQLKIFGEKVEQRMLGEGGDFGRGDYKLFISVFADDKIRRNVVQDWIDAQGRRGGGRGGRGGRGR